MMWAASLNCYLYINAKEVHTRMAVPVIAGTSYSEKPIEQGG